MKIHTLRARRVLNDAKLALKKFEEEPIDVEFRHLVVLCFALIRTVGHALEAENRSDPSADEIQNIYYKKRIKNERIFKEFIKGGRDLVLKEYMSNTKWQSVTPLSGETYMQYVVNIGDITDADFCVLMQESIDFWELHLNAIDELSRKT